MNLLLFPRTSLVMDEDETRSWESAVDMIAAMTAAKITPAMNGMNRSPAIMRNACSGL